jgi:ABC-type glycerol-3-phosphate transport system permease component
MAMDHSLVATSFASTLHINADPGLYIQQNWLTILIVGIIMLAILIPLFWGMKKTFKDEDIKNVMDQYLPNRKKR